MLSDNDLFLHLCEARSLIESQTSTTVWRTSLRIHELIRMKFPHARSNEGIRDEVKFAQILASLCDEEELVGQKLPHLMGERYEEGHHEPILLSDTQILKNGASEILTASSIVPPFQRISVRGVIVQRELFRLMQEGYNFREASEIVYKLDPSIRDTYVTEFRTEGMSGGNIFYKRRISRSSPRRGKSLPKIPEVLS
ncbi:MAG: hypothetical protein HHAS10_00130 [Candidatus Altimarinota bacterium]